MSPPPPPQLAEGQPAAVQVVPGQETLTISVIPPEGTWLKAEAEPPLEVIGILPGQSPDEVIVSIEEIPTVPVRDNIWAVDPAANESPPIVVVVISFTLQDLQLSIEPAEGSIHGGTVVKVTGIGFLDTPRVYFSNNECEVVRWISFGLMWCRRGEERSFTSSTVSQSASARRMPA